MGTLNNKVAIVSGSGRGIGREIALKLASEGANVVVNDLDAEPAKETVVAVEAAGGKAVEYPIARMYADARVQRIYAGANEVMNELIARSL
jgi:NAD(P)-dependent dehydrogenase (short-subunit alcohol dehydrogenase family)